MATLSQFRCDVPGLDALATLREAPLPLGLKSSPAQRTFHRDIYLDTGDRSLATRGISCRLRIEADDRRVLTLTVGGGRGGQSPPQRWDAEVVELDARKALEGTTEPARRLRGLVDPALLRPRIELETERWTRIASGGWLRRRPRFGFVYDSSTVRQGGLARTFEELQVRRLAPGGPHLDQLAATLERLHGLRPILTPKYERAVQLVEAMAGEVASRMLASWRSVSLLAFDGGGIAFVEEDGGIAVPLARGSGEEACRYLLRHIFGSGVGELTLLGTTPPTEDRPGLEVWLARKIRGRDAADSAVGADGAGRAKGKVIWLTLPEALAKVGTPELRSPETLAALALAARADLAPPPDSIEATHARSTPTGSRRVSGSTVASAYVRSDAPAEQFLNVELSQLAFHVRVLELAEDPGTPLAERLRFLAIVSQNLDEFFSVRVGTLKLAIASGSTKRSFDGLSPSEQFDAVAARVPSVLGRHTRCMEECFDLLAMRDTRLRRWADLDPATQRALTQHFDAELFPILTPRAVTLSPGHPFPVIPHLALAFAVIVRDVHTGPIHFAYLAVPTRVDRFLPVPGTTDLIPVEEVVRAHLRAFYPERPVEQAWLFRVTRAADLDMNEEEAGDFLQAIEEEVGRRRLNAPVRVEVERGMPSAVRELLLRELRFERRGVAITLGEADVYEVGGLIDRSCLRDLAARTLPADSFPPFSPWRPFASDKSLFAQIGQGDLLVHHPYDDFGATVGRFLEEAAADPDVLAIKITLYRTGDRSPVVDSLLEAARRGKDIAVFVELKARFDEARNVSWTRRLEEAGIQVVYGLVGLKTHAKILLVVRRTAEGLKRYVHIGTGNYNAATARIYTDLGLFTADPEIASDVTDLFNQLTGSSQAPTGSFRLLLVSPANMVPELVHRIEREITHAQTGRSGRIRAQVNGLEDPEIVGALYRASQAGVEIDLLVRSLCVLRPGVPGLSERIRVRSLLGRFLEHQRIFHFGNGGEDEYLIGSTDWRPRNLRRRVEVVVPVRRPELKTRLDRLLTELLEEPSNWVLDGDGVYDRPAVPSAERPHVQDRLFAN